MGCQTLTPLNLDSAPDRTGAIERLTTSSAAQFPTSISADGTRVVLFMVAVAARSHRVPGRRSFWQPKAESRKPRAES